MLIAAIRMALYLLAETPDPACEQPIVDACVDTAATDGSLSCMSDDIPALAWCAWLPSSPLALEVEHELAHQLCEVTVYALLCTDCADDETTDVGEALSEVLCRNEVP